jgi:hypothetical protein
MKNIQSNIYKYSKDLNLALYSEIKNDENNVNSKNNASFNKQQLFLKELSNILEDKLKTNIRLHQKGFEIYKQKILSDKTLILNTISNDIKNLTINQLLDVLKQIKEEDNKEKMNKLFNFGKNMNNIISNNSHNKNGDIDLNNENQNSNEMINKMFNEYSNLKNMDIINNNQFTPDFNKLVIDSNSKKNCIEYNIQNNNNANNKLGFKNMRYNDPRLIYHSKSPPVFKKQDSKIIAENRNANNQLNFDEPQNC